MPQPASKPVTKFPAAGLAERAVRMLPVAVVVAALAGCSLPEVLPTHKGPTAGPSPFGPGYTQMQAAQQEAWGSSATGLVPASDAPLTPASVAEAPQVVEAPAAPAYPAPSVDEAPLRKNIPSGSGGIRY